MDLATESDVETQLGHQLSSSELDRLPGLVLKASAIVQGYLRVVYTDVEDIPSAVRIVVASMVARVLTTGGVITPGVTSESVTTGPHTWARQFADGTNSIEPWLSKSDRIILQGITGSGYVSVGLGSERS
ncbi:hypothetical protein [Nocardia sp. NPDC057030]|uniref:hypothetical protein n=1 Tax=unclassified Nocardia TaxID=2637762 RepID=UPI003641BCB7